MPLSSSIAARLQLQHKTIRELAGGLSDSSLRYPEHPGKWSAFENIAHLAAYQPVFISRLERIGREPSPAFERYVAENDPMFPHYLERSPAELFENIDGDRARILSQLDTGGEALLGKTGVHPKFGLLTVTGWTEFFLLHEAHHLYTLFMLVCDLRKNGH
jgi:hypothetical protein